MENRETKSIILPKTKKEAVIYSYITGGEKRDITRILTSSLSAMPSGETKGEMPMSLVYEANDKAIETLVVSVGGETENIPAIVSDLPSQDYAFLVAEINRITKDEDFLG